MKHPRSATGSVPVRATGVASCHTAVGLCASVLFLALSAAAHATPTPTTTFVKPTNTPRATRTPKGLSGVSSCRLPLPEAMDVATLTVTSLGNVTQTFDLSSPTFANEYDIAIFKHTNSLGERRLQCRLQNIDPQLVVFQSGTLPINGWLCIRPSTKECKRGRIDCDGGSDLGFVVIGDSNIGSCTSRKKCRRACSKYCQDIDEKHYGAACTDQICQCRCIASRAGSAGVPGIAQCYLGAHITIEAALPCDGTDALVDFGEQCFPMTTSSSLSDITHADFSMSEIGPVSEFGKVAVQCQDIAFSNGAVGEVMIGHEPVIFGPAPSDVILTLHMPCEPPRPTRTPLGEP